jgi:two-component system LytT family sensor kinase
MDASRLPIQSRRWLVIASIWLGFGLFDATQTVFSMRAQGMHHAWVFLFATLVLAWLPLALATPIVLRLGRTFPPVRWRPFSTWLVHLSACSAICLAATAWNAGLEKLLNPWLVSGGPGPFLELWRYKFYNSLLSYLVLYASLLAISSMLESRERLAHQQTEAARLNEQLSKAQLNALRRQIEPHFLFNALNGIVGLVREGKNDSAVKMIVALSDFLRRVVEDTNRQEVPLQEEMEALLRYLDIQTMRFAERLQLSVTVPSELLPARVPSFVLQPMVENAIKHGIAKRAQGGAIRITASRSHGMLTLKVYNDGPHLAPESESAPSGVGMFNVRTRLQSLYGNAFELDMQNQDPDGVEVSVSVPFKES